MANAIKTFRKFLTSNGEDYLTGLGATQSQAKNILQQVTNTRNFNVKSINNFKAQSDKDLLNTALEDFNKSKSTSTTTKTQNKKQDQISTDYSYSDPTKLDTTAEWEALGREHANISKTPDSGYGVEEYEEILQRNAKNAQQREAAASRRAEIKAQQEAATEVSVPFNADTATSKSIQRHNDKIKGRKYQGRDPSRTQEGKERVKKISSDEKELDELYDSADQSTRASRRQVRREDDKAKRDKILEKETEESNRILANDIANATGEEETLLRHQKNRETVDRIKAERNARENSKQNPSSLKITNKNRRRLEQNRDDAQKRLDNWSSYEESQIDSFIEKNGYDLDKIEDFQKNVLDKEKSRLQAMVNNRAVEQDRIKAQAEVSEQINAEKIAKELEHTADSTGSTGISSITNDSSISPTKPKVNPDKPNGNSSPGKKEPKNENEQLKPEDNGKQSGKKNKNEQSGQKSNNKQSGGGLSFSGNAKAHMMKRLKKEMKNVDVNNIDQVSAFLGKQVSEEELKNSKNIKKMMRHKVAQKMKNEGPGVWDYVAGNPNTSAAVGGSLVLTGLAATTMNNGRKSNSQLYSSPI